MWSIHQSSLPPARNMVPTYNLFIAMGVLFVCATAQNYPGMERLTSGYGDQRQGFRDNSQGFEGYNENKYKTDIYTDPEYYGYEATFPGGRALYKGYKTQGSDGFGAGGRGSGVNREQARGRYNYDQADRY